MAKKSGQDDQSSRTRTGKMTKPQIEHAYKLEIMRTCQIYGKDFETTKAYFKSKGYTLGRTQFTDLRNELKSRKIVKEWFSKEALYAMEEDHELSVERIRLIENRLMEEFEQVSATTYYKYVNAGSKEQELIKNKAHNVHDMLRIIAQFESLQSIKTKMFSATPLVQEIMEVHAQQEEEKEKASFSKRVTQDATN